MFKLVTCNTIKENHTTKKDSKKTSTIELGEQHKEVDVEYQEISGQHENMGRQH